MGLKIGKDPVKVYQYRTCNSVGCIVTAPFDDKLAASLKGTDDATVMFADLRGYTALTQSIDQSALMSLLGAFYDECAAAIWRYDGLLNKTIGDAVYAIINFPVRRTDHAIQAVLAAREIQQRFRQRGEELMRVTGLCEREAEIGVWIGIDSGDTNFGEFGDAHRDLTAIGTVVNRAARTQSAARSGEILVTSVVRDRAGGMIDGVGTDHILKGFQHPVTLFRA